MPGEPEERTRDKRLREGIPVADADLQALKDAARSRHVAFPF
jgi:LDH2 family malate/lactate/ureidoglycolate dehydrogenase